MSGNDGTLNRMKVLITGGAGFLGTRLTRTLLKRGQISGAAITQVALADLYPPKDDLISDPRVRAWTGALLDQCTALAQQEFDLVFHLAAAVSGECEADLELGLRANLDTTRALLDALRQTGKPRVVFSSSVAVFGGDVDLPMPRVIHDDTLPVPQTSYGIQKYMCEQLLADYTRRGLLEGRSTRLMTVTVRPGRPNAAASGFLSSIIREPLSGKQAICPVSPDMVAAVASPQRAIEGLLAAAEATPERWGSRTALNLPGLTVRVSEMLDALEVTGGPAARKLVVFEVNPLITRMMSGWPSAFESARARRLGLAADPDFLSVVRQFQKEQTP
ncbi:MAG: D-erythronate dehydrogenase [Acidobacteriaceae bacterium]